ncbi:MAG TPA: CapA family protein, partial [Conexibacter sp.]|nr:CapA family protein [Conexibacter sp.]
DVAAMGFDVVGLANNQTLNYGLDGLAQTIELLGAHGVRHVGAGADAEAAWAPELVSGGGVRAALLACTCVAPPEWAATETRGGLAALRVRTAYEVDARWEREEPGVAPRVRTWIEDDELARARDAVARAAAQADAVLVAVHWGVGASAARADYQEQLAGVLVAAGATCVLGGHPPAPQGLALRDGALVSYGQGTFVRQQPRAPELAALYAAMPRAGALLRLRLAPDGGAAAALLPALLGERERAGLAAGREAAAVLDEILARSDLGGAAPEVRDGALELAIR